MTAEDPRAPEEQQGAPAAAPAPAPAPAYFHYLGALLITGIVTGISFFIKDPSSRWTVFGVATAMDLGIIFVALKPAPKSPDD